jgi:uncharacterized membrane protein
VRPLGIALVLGGLGASLSWLEEIYPIFGNWVPSLLFPARSDPVVAQVILSDIATSIMTVVSIVFAILLMTLTLASMQFSPRILISFSRDRTTQRTLGIFLGTFCYCIAALPAARTTPHPFAPVATVMGAMILAIGCVGCLLYFIHHISHAISVNFIVDRIAAETEAVIDELMPMPRKSQNLNPPPAMSTIPWDSVIQTDQSGYIRFIDVNRIFELARYDRVKLQVLRRVGHFVPAGIPLLNVTNGDRLSPGASDEMRKAFDIGPSRTLQQDIEFGALQIVDIALRAISPAVNDPSTAINCIDQLSRILIRFGARQDPASVVYDLPGEIRIIVPWIDFEGLLDTSFDQIRHYGATDAAVSLRLLRALSDVAAACAEPAFRRLAVVRGKRIIDGCDRVRIGDQFPVLQSRFSSLEKLAAGTSPLAVM